MDLTKYMQMADQIKHDWDIWLNILLAIGGALIAVAMAYAIIDVPSTGNARLPQRRFWNFGKLPLMLASLVLAEWWALVRNVHGSEPFEAGEWRSKFVIFSLRAIWSAASLRRLFLHFVSKRENGASSIRSGDWVSLR